MESRLKTNARIESSIKTNYIKAQEDEMFKKLVNSFDIEEKEKIINTSKFQDTIKCLKNCKNCKGLMDCKNSNIG